MAIDYKHGSTTGTFKTRKYKFTGKLSMADEIIAEKSNDIKRYIPQNVIREFLRNHTIRVNEEVTVVIEFFGHPCFKPIQSNPLYHRLENSGIINLEILNHVK